MVWICLLDSLEYFFFTNPQETPVDAIINVFVGCHGMIRAVAPAQLTKPGCQTYRLLCHSNSTLILCRLCLPVLLFCPWCLRPGQCLCVPTPRWHLRGRILFVVQDVVWQIFFAGDHRKVHQSLDVFFFIFSLHGVVSCATSDALLKGTSFCQWEEVDGKFRTSRRTRWGGVPQFQRLWVKVQVS